MRNKIILLICLLILPLIVYAEDTCDSNEVRIKDLELVNITGMTEELEDADIDGNTIVIDAKMYEVGDSIEYQFTVENESNNDFIIDAKDLVRSDPYISYELDSEDHSNLVKHATSKDFTLTASYNNEIPEEEFKAGKYDGSINMIIDTKDPSIINPLTGNFFYIFLIILFLICLVLGNKIRKNYFNIIPIFVILFIPYITNALCNFEMCLDINLDIAYVKPNPCTYNGAMVNNAEYTNGQYSYLYKPSAYISGENVTLDGWRVSLIDKNSTSPVTTKLCTSINDKPIVSTNAMFAHSKTESIDLSSLDTSNVVDMGDMFSYLENVSQLDVRNLNTQNTKLFYEMFYNSKLIEELDVSGFDTSNGINFSYMFYGTNSIHELDLSNFNTSNATHMNSMFSNSGLTSLDISYFDTSNVVDYSYIFEKLQMENLNMDNFVYNGRRFFDNTKIINISAKNIKFKTNPQYGLFGFGDIVNLKTIDVSNWDVSQISAMDGIFGKATSLEEIVGLDTWDLSSITDLSNLFEECTKLTTLDLSEWDVSNVSKIADFCYHCDSLKTVIIDNWDLESFGPYEFKNLLCTTPSLEHVSMKNWKIPSSFNYFLSLNFCTGEVESIDVSNWDLSRTTVLEGTLNGNSHLKNIIGLDTWDTSHITSMNSLFYGDSNLETLDLSSFDTSNVTDTDGMFTNCNSLTTVYARTNNDLLKFNSSSGKPSNVQVVLKN